MGAIGEIGRKFLEFLDPKENQTRLPPQKSPPCGESFKHHYLHHFLPYETFDPEKGLFFNRSSVGFVFEIAPLVGNSEEMQREISGLFQNTLPEGSSLQFMLWADPKVGDLIDSWSHSREEMRGAIGEIGSNRNDFLKSLVFDKELDSQLRNYQCIVSYSQPTIPDNAYEMNRLLILKDQVRTAFETLNVPLKAWGSEELLNTLYSLLSPEENLYNLGLKWDSLNPLSHQMTSKIHDYKIEKDEIVVSTPHEDPWHIRSYSVQQQPDYWSLSAMTELIGDFERDPLRLKVPFLIHYGIHISSQEKTKMRVQSRESWVEQQSYSKIGKRIPILKKQARELNLVREHLSRGERLVETNLTVSLISPGKKVEEAESTLISLFRSNKWNLQRDVYLQLQLFLSHLPMFWGEGMVPELKYNNRLKTTISTESSNLLPIQGEWKGTHSQGMILTGRRGQLFTWSPFDNTGGNYNVTVVGSSGSGKSVFMQELMTSTLGIGGRVFVLDVGRSFEKVSHLLGGEFVEFSSKNPVCVNPFSFIPENDPEAASDFLGLMKPIVSLMAAPTGGTTDLENAQIERAIAEAWIKKGRQATMTDVANFLLSQKEGVSQELGQKLFPYTKKGVYGRYFEGSSTVDLNSKLVVLELEELKERKDLQSVVVQIMILHITNNLYLGDRKTPTSIILDEAWDMLRAPQSGIFIETCARRLRKYNGSLVVGTQSVNDFYTTPGAQAAFDNSDWMILLSQKAESIEMLKRTGRVKVEGVMESYLRSLKTKAGKYAECMIYGPHGFAIGRLLLDPFSMILYSTKADEYAAVKDLMRQGLSLERAIHSVSERRAS